MYGDRFKAIMDCRGQFAARKCVIVPRRLGHRQNRYPGKRRIIEPSRSAAAPIDLAAAVRSQPADERAVNAMKKTNRLGLLLLMMGTLSLSLAVETGMFRLLSITESEKLILVSQIPGKTKYILDASAAKITVKGKPAELKELKQFSIIQIKLELKKFARNGIDIDGTASEIRVSPPEPSK